MILRDDQGLRYLLVERGHNEAKRRKDPHRWNYSVWRYMSSCSSVGPALCDPVDCSTPGYMASYMTLNICLIAQSVEHHEWTQTGTLDFGQYDVHLMYHSGKGWLWDRLWSGKGGDRGIWEISVFSARFYYEPKTAQKIVYWERQRENGVWTNTVCRAVFIHAPLPSSHTQPFKCQADCPVRQHLFALWLLPRQFLHDVPFCSKLSNCLHS